MEYHPETPRALGVASPTWVPVCGAAVSPSVIRSSNDLLRHQNATVDGMFNNNNNNDHDNQVATLNAEKAAVVGRQTSSLSALTLVAIAVTIVALACEGLCSNDSTGNRNAVIPYDFYSFASGVAFSACVAWLIWELPYMHRGAVSRRKGPRASRRMVVGGRGVPYGARVLNE